MSFHTFFDFATGLQRPLSVPHGTKAAVQTHVAKVEQTLGLCRTQYQNNLPHWDRWKRDWSHLDDTTLCQTVSRHNAWVRWLYARLADWSRAPVVDGETLTPEEAAGFWHALERLDVPPARWTREYYRERMEVLYSVMRGRESEGIRLDTKALTPRQAAAVIGLFAEFLDAGDLRLDVPKGWDHLQAAYDGGYAWCERPRCGAIAADDIATCRSRTCPLREDV